MQLRFGRRDKAPPKPTPKPLVYCVGRATTRSGEIAPGKALFISNAASASVICSTTADTRPTVLVVVKLSFLESALPQSSSLGDSAVEEITQPTTGAV